MSSMTPPGIDQPERRSGADFSDDNAPPIRVVIGENHPMIREGLEARLERTPGIQVVGTAGDGATTVALVGEHHPDVLLVDAVLPDMTGAEVARRVRDIQPDLAIVVLTAHDDAVFLRPLLQLGVRGHIRKTATGEEIVRAVQQAAAGQPLPATEALAEVGAGRAPRLTTRELQVLQLLASGRRNAEIAETLDVSVKTVEFHVTNVLAKLGVRSRSQAIRKAVQQGIVSIEEFVEGHR